MVAQLVQLINTARKSRAVASVPVAGDMKLFVYLMAQGVVVGLGYDRDSAHRVQTEMVLQRRSAHMARYGAWLPAVFSDGSWYVLRRVTDGASHFDAAPLSSDDLAAAQELLS